MRKTIIAVLISIVFTFIVTENYMLSNLQVTGENGAYMVTVFGNDFVYE